MNVVIVRKFPERTRRLILSKFPHDWKVVMVTPEELDKELEDVEAIIPEHHIIDGPLLDRAKNLKLIQTGAGYDNMMVDECTKRGSEVSWRNGKPGSRTRFTGKGSGESPLRRKCPIPFDV